jgi:outer membrane protein assembly factor BamB
MRTRDILLAPAWYPHEVAAAAMQMRSRALTPGLPLLMALVCSAQAARPTSAGSAQDSVQRAEAAPLAARLLWLTELGAESIVAAPGSPLVGHDQLVASVPGAAYIFKLTADGGLHRRLRLAADPAAPYGVAVTAAGVALADRQGALSVWAVASNGEPSLRWRRDLAERITSVGWDGGPLVLAATWKGRLQALSATDGAPVWSVDLGGRAEAPGVAAGRDVFVATKTRTLLRIDAATGALRWKASLPGTAQHPPVLLAEDPSPRFVVCGTWEGELLAYDAASGRLRWSAPLGARLASAPLAVPGIVAVVTADGTAHGYDPAGRLSWTTPGVASGPATLLAQELAGRAPRLVSVSRSLTALDTATGRLVEAYPQGALDDLRRRFADAMLEGVKTYAEAEKATLQEQEAFEIAGPSFGPARLFGPHLAFGSEEGWAYVFDAARLRPTARYHAGEPATGVSAALAGRALAAAGEDLFALDLQTGKTVWKRTVGSRPVTISADETLGVLAGGRVHAIAAADGSLEWSLRGRFRSFAPPPATADAREEDKAPWLVDDGEGNLRALLPPGRFVGDPLAAGGELLAVAPVAPRAWLAAIREGTLFGVAWEDLPATEPGAPTGRLVRTTEKEWPEPLAEINVASGRVLVRSASGALASLDASSLEEGFRLSLSKEDRIQVLANENALLVLGATALRIYDWVSGAMTSEIETADGVLAAILREGSLEWLDRTGGVHRAGLADGRTATARLELPLVQATPAGEGFLVTTSAGEVGFVQLAAGVTAVPSDQTRGVTQ